MERSWFSDIIRWIFGTLDGIVYGLISTIYTLLNEIAHFKVFDNATLNDFSSRIYALLGIIMLFKLSFSFINYIINPDAFTDKEKGVQNIIKNIVVMFAMLIMCPWAFSQLWGLQAAILDDQMIARFVFGSLSQEPGKDKYLESCDESINNSEANAGNFIAIMALRGFYMPYNYTDTDITQDDNFQKVKEKVEEDLCKASAGSAEDMLVSSIYNKYDDVQLGGGGEYYIMEYRWGVSTVVGVVILLILVGFCMDVATRMVKLSFLQLIAPVPIISYIDPASGKNGIFKKWLMEVGKTWVSVFIRLLALFLAVAVIQNIGKLVSVDDTAREASFWVQLFVIIGALMFAKQLPKLLSTIFGINLDGAFNLNPIKKFQDQALYGKQITGLAGAGTAMIAAGVGSGIAHRIARQKQMKNLNQEHDKLQDLNQQRRQNLLDRQANRTQLSSLETQRKNAERDVLNATNNDDLYKAYNKWERLNLKIEAKEADIKNNEAKDSQLADQIFSQAEKYQKTKQDVADSRLHNKVDRGYLGEIARGAIYGAKNGYAKPGHLIHNTAEAIKDSSEMRNYREKYSISDQMGDRAAAVLGIKNESGTTSIVKKELKAQNDSLNEINRSIDLLNRSISQIAGEMGAEFQKAIKYAPNGRMEINTAYTGPQAHRIPDLEKLISSYYGRVDEKVRVEKAIKDLNDTADSVKPGNSKK